MDPSTYKFDTLSLHGGHQPDKNYGSRAVPIYQTTSYVFQDTDHAAALFNLEQVATFTAGFLIQLSEFLKREFVL